MTEDDNYARPSPTGVAAGAEVRRLRGELEKWTALARKWETRAKENADKAHQFEEVSQELAGLRSAFVRVNADLRSEKAKAQIYKNTYHSLRLSVEARLDRVADLLEDTEWVEENAPTPQRPEKELRNHD